MKKLYIIVVMLCIISTSFSQTSNIKFSKALGNKLTNLSSTVEILVWVYFNDKGNSTNNFYLNNPQLVVSEKSLKRREKVLGNNSALTFKDLPVNTDYITQLQSLGFKLKWSSKWLNAVSGIHR